ncbi:MAG: universal stress protein [Deltaproteobacteria bacterium]|nr:universal stress protein [Deltaproteobacteria bacterium]
MSEVKKIMAAIAFSKYSQGILNYAAKLAQDLEAGLVVGNVINIRDVRAVGKIEAMGYKVDADDYVKGIREERAARLEEMLKSSGIPAEKVSAVYEVGHPSEKLLKIVEDEKVDLIVMGSKGRSDLPNVFVGSVAEKMFRHSPTPVLFYRG